MFAGINKHLKSRSRISDKTNQIINLIIGIVILIGGTLLLSSGYSGDRQYQHLISDGNTTTATITEVVASRIDSKNGAPRRYSELKTYVYSVNDIEYSFKERKERTSNSPRKGSTVEVFYDKSNPSMAVTKRSENRETTPQFIPYALIVFGSIITINCIRGIRNS